jgi:hypothetical protein
VECEVHDVDDGDGCAEFLWGFPVGRDRYRIESVPFGVRFVALGDVVRTGPRGGCRCPEFVEVVWPSGNGTLWVHPPSDLDRQAVHDIIEDFGDLGMAGERASCGLLALDVPAWVDPSEALDLLEEGRAEGRWTYQLACVDPAWLWP